MCVSHDPGFENLKTCLKQNSDYRFSHAAGIKMALYMLSEEAYDLALVDASLPDDGARTLSKKVHALFPQTAVAFLAAGDYALDMTLEFGKGSDVLEKSKMTPRSLSRLISSCLEKKRLKRELSLAGERLTRLTCLDIATGMLHHKQFMTFLGREVAAVKDFGKGLCLCTIGIQGTGFFADDCVNEDHIRTLISHVLEKYLREYDTAALFPSTRLAILMPGTHIDSAVLLVEGLLERIVEIAERKKDDENMPGPVKVWAGLAFFQKGTPMTAKKLFRQSQDALNAALNQGSGLVVRYDDVADSTGNVVVPPGGSCAL